MDERPAHHEHPAPAEDHAAAPDGPREPTPDPQDELPADLGARLELDAWPAQRWADLIESLIDPEILEKGIEIARRRRGPTVRVSPGEISVMVPDPPRSRRTVALEAPVIEHEHWERVAKRAAADPILSSQIISGELPAELQAAAAHAELHLLPHPADLVARRGRLALEWDENVAAAAVAFARRLDEEPGLLLAFRGMTAEAFQELVRQRAALASSGGRGAPAYAQRPPIGPDQEPPPLELSLDSFWAAGPGLAELETPIRPPDHPHSLLRRLGASPFQDRARFPLIGLLATCYDLMTQAEVARAAAPPETETDAETEADAESERQPDAAAPLD